MAITEQQKQTTARHDLGGDALQALQDHLAAVGGPMDASAYYHTRTALTGADQTIALGAAYHNIKVWLDSGASPCYIAVDAAANSDDPRIDDSVAYSRHFDADGVANIYIESTGAVGYINVEAW